LEPSSTEAAPLTFQRPVPRRGLPRQLPRRQQEHQARQAAVEFHQWAGPLSLSCGEAARCLDVPRRTLSRWKQLAAGPPQADWSPMPRGRPAPRSSRHDRNAVVEVLRTAGPAIGVTPLRGLFPHMPRRELAEMLARARRICRKKNQRLLHVLHWHRPGAVWAVDFAQPPFPVDGIYPQILAVRDLASGCQLLWMGMPRADEQSTRDALEALFAQHGAPLVLKSDNGSAFIALELGEFLESQGLTRLLSPPARPQYNGACEAGIGSLKTNTHHIASAGGHPDRWTSGDVEGARMLVNQLARPHGEHGPTPHEAWQARVRLDDHERDAFAAALALQRHELAQQAQIENLNPQQLAAVERNAIQRTLVQFQFLSYTRRLFTPPLHALKRAKIC
jgi:transposase InsO family protein